MKCRRILSVLSALTLMAGSMTGISVSAAEKGAGDVDQNGKVEIADAIMLARWLAEDDITVTTAGLADADLNGDGIVTSEDQGKLLCRLAGIPEEQPAERRSVDLLKGIEASEGIKGKAADAAFVGAQSKFSVDLLKQALEKETDKREIGVRQARAFRQEVWITPNEAARKVFLIPEADCLNNEGQNALLKVLEEPPPYAALLLLGRNPGAFLPTVRSRCLTLRLGSPGEASGESDSAALLAEAFIRGDRLAWMRAAFPCEKLDREKFDRLVEELDTAAALRAKAGEGEARARALRLSALTFRIREMRQVNLSAGHCLGWLCTMM